MAQGQRVGTQYHSFVHIERSDCQSILAEMNEVYQKFSKIFSDCLYAGTLEQFAAIYAEDNLAPTTDLRKHIEDKINTSFDFAQCPSARPTLDGILIKLQSAKNALELCESSAVGPKEMGIIFRDRCQR